MESVSSIFPIARYTCCRRSKYRRSWSALPPSAWPYGRVVLVAQAVPKNPTKETKADLRKNRALLLGTLQQLDVQVREAP